MMIYLWTDLKLEGHTPLTPQACLACSITRWMAPRRGTLARVHCHEYRYQKTLHEDGYER
jgi:hypothetical protein